MSEQLLIILAIVLVVVLLGVVALIYYRKKHPRKDKRLGRSDGSRKVVAPARAFARSHRFRLIAPAHLLANKKGAKLDAIIVGYFGVLGVIGLGYNGNIYGAANESERLQINEGGQRTYFPNPMDEASAAVRVIRNTLSSPKLKQIPVEVVAVFTDSTVQLAVPKTAGPHSLKTFKALLHKDKYLDDTGLDLDAVEAAIRAAVVE